MLNRIDTLKLKDSKSAPRPSPLDHGTGTTLGRSVLYIHGASLTAGTTTSIGPIHDHIEYIATHGRRGALVAPFSRSILLRPEVEASCSLR